MKKISEAKLLEKVREIKEKDLTIGEIAKKVGINTTTLHKYRKLCIELDDEIKERRQGVHHSSKSHSFNSKAYFEITGQRLESVSNRKGISPLKKNIIRKSEEIDCLKSRLLGVKVGTKNEAILYKHQACKYLHLANESLRLLIKIIN